MRRSDEYLVFPNMEDKNIISKNILMYHQVLKTDITDVSKDWFGFSITVF